MKKDSGIYQITNAKTGRVYVGSAVNIGDRWYRHKLHLKRGIHNCKPLQNAWNTYGESAFVFDVLEKVEDKSLLLVREQFYLDKIRPFDKSIGYNCCPVASSTLGIKYTDEAKEKLSKSTKASHEKGCYAEKALLQKGVPHSEEHKRKIAESLKRRHESGFKFSAERNAKISAARTGKKYPNLSKSLKLSAANKRALSEPLTTI